MTSRIVVFGATGYTGRLVTAALVERGARPVIAGRHRSALDDLAAEHGGLDSAVADAQEPASVRALVEAGDVLVTTVGPFTLRGHAALEAAIDAGAHYVDSTGESGFVRHVVLDAGPRAERAGSALLTAFGYDFVPGHVAAGLAVEAAEAAGGVVGGVQVVYSGLVGGMSSGTRTTGSVMVTESTHRLEAGRLVERPTGRDVAVVDDAGHRRQTVLVGGTEPVLASHQWPSVTDVSVWLDLGAVVWLAKLGSYVAPTAMRIPQLRSWVRRASGGTGTGPDAAARARSSCSVLAIASDADGNELARARVRGPNVYDLTATTMAEGALRLRDDGPPRPGALGPLELFAPLDAHAGAARLGLELA